MQFLTDTCKVFIVYSHALFAQGVNSLLSREPGVQVIGMDADRGRAAERIRSLCPDVVVVDGDRTDAELLEVMSLILNEVPATKLISISLQNNQANVLRIEHLFIGEAEDLIQAIRTA